MRLLPVLSEIARLRVQVATKYSKDQVRELVAEAFISGFHYAAKDSGRLLRDVAWSDLNTDLTSVIHKEAKKHAKVLVK